MILVFHFFHCLFAIGTDDIVKATHKSNSNNKSKKRQSVSIVIVVVFFFFCKKKWTIFFWHSTISFFYDPRWKKSLVIRNKLHNNVKKTLNKFANNNVRNNWQRDDKLMSKRPNQKNVCFSNAEKDFTLINVNLSFYYICFNCIHYIFPIVWFVWY